MAATNLPSRLINPVRVVRIASTTDHSRLMEGVAYGNGESISAFPRYERLVSCIEKRNLDEPPKRQKARAGISLTKVIKSWMSSYSWLTPWARSNPSIGPVVAGRRHSIFVTWSQCRRNALAGMHRVGQWNMAVTLTVFNGCAVSCELCSVRECRIWIL